MPKITIELTDAEVAGIQAAMESANAGMPEMVADPLSLKGDKMIPNPDLYADWTEYIDRRVHEVAGNYIDQHIPSVDKVLAKLSSKEREVVEANLAVPLRDAAGVLARR